MTIFICTNNKGKLREFEKHFKEQVIGVSDLEISLNLKYQEPSEDSNSFLSNAFSKLFSALKFIVASNDENLGILSNINQIVVDDSGLCVPGLQFEPGVHSAIYAGLPRNDEKNNLKVIEQINKNKNSKSLSDQKRLDAFFICFLFSITFDDLQKFNFIKKMNAVHAKEFENKNVAEMEKDFLNQVNFSLPSGNFFHKVPMNLFSNSLPANVFIDIFCGFCTGEVSTKMQQSSSFGHGYDPLFYPRIHPDLSFAEISIEEKNKISHRALAMKKMSN